MHAVPQIPFRFNVYHIILTVFITVCFFRTRNNDKLSLSRNLLLALLSLIEIIESVREEEE